MGGFQQLCLLCCCQLNLVFWCFSSKATVTNGDFEQKHRFPCRGPCEISWIMVWMTRWWQLKYFLCSSLPGEMIQFDEHIFQMGWLKPPTTWWIPTNDGFHDMIWTSQLWIHLSLQNWASKKTTRSFSRDYWLVGTIELCEKSVASFWNKASSDFLARTDQPGYTWIDCLFSFSAYSIIWL